MPVIIALEKLHKIPLKSWTGPFLTQGNLPLLKSRLLVQVTPPQPLYRGLMESRRTGGFVVCRACSAARRCKSSTQPDGGEGLAMTQGLSPRGEV